MKYHYFIEDKYFTTKKEVLKYKESKNIKKRIKVVYNEQGIDPEKIYIYTPENILSLIPSNVTDYMLEEEIEDIKKIIFDNVNFDKLNEDLPLILFPGNKKIEIIEI